MKAVISIAFSISKWMRGAIRCITGSNPYFLVIYMDSLNSFELEKRERKTGSRALLQHAARTRGGILQRQNSTTALGSVKGPSQGHQQLGPLQGRSCTWTQICPWCSQRAKYARGEHRIVFLIPPKRAAYDWKRRMSWCWLAFMPSFLSCKVN